MRHTNPQQELREGGDQLGWHRWGGCSHPGTRPGGKHIYPVSFLPEQRSFPDWVTSLPPPAPTPGPHHHPHTEAPHVSCPGISWDVENYTPRDGASLETLEVDSAVQGVGGEVWLGGRGGAAPAVRSHHRGVEPTRSAVSGSESRPRNGPPQHVGREGAGTQGGLAGSRVP